MYKYVLYDFLKIRLNVTKHKQKDQYDSWQSRIKQGYILMF